MNDLQLPFDYAALDTETRVVVQQRTEEIRVLVRRSAQDIIDIGAKLIEVKARLGHGNFGPWLGAEFGWSQQTATNFMHVADKFKTVLNLESIATKALYLLSAPSTPEPARLEAITRATNGETITHALAREIVTEYKPTPAILNDGQRVAGPIGAYWLNGDTKECCNCHKPWQAPIDYCPYCNQSQDLRVLMAQRNELKLSPVMGRGVAYSPVVEYEPEIDAEPEPEPMNDQKQRAQQAMAATMYSHDSLDYYTPQDIIEAARAVMGGIDLDPASCAMAQAWIDAAQYYTIVDDGLKQPWAGRVWLNPPYSYTDGKSNQDLWSSRLEAEYNSGAVEEGVLLVKAALGYKWFERLWDAWPVCFVRERLSFVLPNGDDSGQSKQATAIFYLGPNVQKFVEVFRMQGRVILPEAQHRD